MPDQPLKPLILAIDTTREFGSLALSRGESLLEEVPLHEPTGFAHVLYPHLEALLARHRLGPADIDCFAAASGPGSFTGVRVGLACVKGLAEALAKPAVAISSLQAVACFGTAKLRAPVLDARRGEIYGAVYDSQAALVLPEVVARLDRWLGTLPAAVEFVALSPILDRWLETLPPAVEFVALSPIPDLPPATVAPPSQAAAIAHLAAARYRRGEACDPAALDANYVRRSDAELFWKE